MAAEAPPPPDHTSTNPDELEQRLVYDSYFEQVPDPSDPTKLIDRPLTSTEAEQTIGSHGYDNEAYVRAAATASAREAVNGAHNEILDNGLAEVLKPEPVVLVRKPFEQPRDITEAERAAFEDLLINVMGRTRDYGDTYGAAQMIWENNASKMGAEINAAIKANPGLVAVVREWRTAVTDNITPAEARLAAAKVKAQEADDRVEDARHASRTATPPQRPDRNDNTIGIGKFRLPKFRTRRGERIYHTDKAGNIIRDADGNEVTKVQHIDTGKDPLAYDAGDGNDRRRPLRRPRVWTTAHGEAQRKFREGVNDYLNHSNSYYTAQAAVRAEVQNRGIEAHSRFSEDEKRRRDGFLDILKYVDGLEPRLDNVVKAYGEPEALRDTVDADLWRWKNSHGFKAERAVHDSMQRSHRYAGALDEALILRDKDGNIVGDLDPRHPDYEGLTDRRVEVGAINIVGRYRQQQILLEMGKVGPASYTPDKGILIHAEQVVIYPDGSHVKLDPLGKPGPRIDEWGKPWAARPRGPIDPEVIDQATPDSEVEAEYKAAYEDWFKNQHSAEATLRARDYATEMSRRAAARYKNNPTDKAAQLTSKQMYYKALYLSILPGEHSPSADVQIQPNGSVVYTDNVGGKPTKVEVHPSGAIIPL